MESSSTLLKMLSKKLAKNTLTVDKKCAILKKVSHVSTFLKNHPEWGKFFKTLPPELSQVAFSLLAIKQGPCIFYEKNPSSTSYEKILALLKSLLPVEDFYAPIGGIVGYQTSALNHISENKSPVEGKYLRPQGVDISKITDSVRGFIRESIEKSALIAEMYPVGGAGDRMNLIDEITHEPLPTAVLSFCEHTLLDRLIHDLEAREYLVYKLTGKRIETKIAMMTSLEKRNHERIKEMLVQRNWFGRDPQSFFLFTQPQVPVMDLEGNWLLKEEYTLYFKPGGHGAIWSKAIQEGVFNALKEAGIQKILIRQINNPIAGIDYGLLAFIGYGLKENKAFGFSSCERLVNANEGMNVILEKKEDMHWKYAITNIEYTEFKRKGIEDIPQKEGGIYSIFPANTNVLFADIKEVEIAERKCPIPGMTMNMKTKFKAIDTSLNYQEVLGGRLESTMQNIADVMMDVFNEPVSEGGEKKFKTFLTFNERIKTISVAKKSLDPAKEGSLLETPHGCLYDMMVNAEDLLSNYCAFNIPKQPSPLEIFEKGLSFIFLYHPTLGPLYEIIRKKVRKGKLERGSELIIEIPEVDIEDLNLQGSLLITSSAPFSAHFKETACRLKNVKVRNKGLETPINISYWERKKRKESLHIILEEGALFEAENIYFDGPFEIRVPKGIKATAVMENGKVCIQESPVSSRWTWLYAFDEKDRITLELLNNSKNNA